MIKGAMSIYTENKNAGMIVAHPDDCVIFALSYIYNHPEHKWTIGYLTYTAQDPRGQGRCTARSQGLHASAARRYAVRQLREMREQRMHEGETLRDNDIQREAVNSLSMNQQPLLEVLGRNVQGMQCLLAMDRDKREPTWRGDPEGRGFGDGVA